MDEIEQCVPNRLRLETRSIMKFYNIFFSPTGGTKKVADIIMNGTKQEAEEDLFRQERKSITFIIQWKISHTLKTQNVQKEKNYEV